jgi:hypothetical protein
MNPYQSPIPIDEESSSRLRFLLIASREAFLFGLGWVVMLAAALLLLAVMPVAIGLAWYQFRRSLAIIDLVPPTVMTFMLPVWQSTLVEAWLDFLHGKS